MTTLRPDVAVIGGGATGLGAASEARHAGADVVLVERARLGGDCTWTGCVPSKTIVEHARAVHRARALRLAPEVDTAAVPARVRDVVRSIAAEEDAPASRSPLTARSRSTAACARRWPASSPPAT
jgi:pyruvate/2-oxoglutarate dehydrogenase complex dihydrolipoamide dehydrogenase (E3) component